MRGFGLFAFIVIGYDLKCMFFWPWDLNMCMHNCGRFIYQTYDFFPIHGNDTFNHIYFHFVVERSQEGIAAEELLCMITQYDLWCLIH